jgi:hypothetical protein
MKTEYFRVSIIVCNIFNHSHCRHLFERLFIHFSTLPIFALRVRTNNTLSSHLSQSSYYIARMILHQLWPQSYVIYRVSYWYLDCEADFQLLLFVKSKWNFVEYLKIALIASYFRLSTRTIFISNFINCDLAIHNFIH